MATLRFVVAAAIGTISEIITVAEGKAIMWKPDPLAQAQLRLEVTARLHREAGKRGYSCSPKLSNIDKRYFAEINYIPLDIGLPGMRHNIKLGTGDTPLEAAMDGYRQTIPLDDMMAVTYLEVELHFLGEAVARYRQREREVEKLETALKDLTAVLSELKDSGRTFHWDQP
jgi:hypothetical protein